MPEFSSYSHDRSEKNFNTQHSGELKMKKITALSLLSVAFLFLTGFNLDNAIVPKDKILSGGVPKDGIPAIMNPKFIDADDAQFLNPDDIVIGVRLGGFAKAYPIKILNMHEVVNDRIKDVPIAVTF